MEWPAAELESRQGMDAMRRALSVLTVLGTSVLFAAGPDAARPPVAAVPAGATVVYSPVAADDHEMQRLLDRLSDLSSLIGQNTQSPDVWRTHLEQAEVLLQLAAHTKGEDHDNWLRLAVDSHYGAVVQSPENDLTAYQRLMDLPGRIAQSFPGSPMIAYAAMQEIQADNIRMLQKDSSPAHAQHHLCERLVRFAGEYPSAPEAPKAVLEAARISETQGRKEDATRCYVYAINHFPEHAAARKAEGGLWRLGQSRGPVRLELPLLFAPGGRDNRPFDLHELHSKLVVVYFWSVPTSWLSYWVSVSGRAPIVWDESLLRNHW